MEDEQFFITHVSKYSGMPSTHCGDIHSVYEYMDAREGLRSRGIGLSDIDPWDFGFTKVSHGSLAELERVHANTEASGEFSNTRVFTF